MRRVAALAVMSLALTVVAIFGFALLHPDRDPAALQKTDVIVVLGAGMDADGRLHRSSILRVEKGVALWTVGLAPKLHFTGGMGVPGGPSAGKQMASLAATLGVDSSAISYEGRSLSTLQNAYFSQPDLAQAQSIRLVSEAFHLPRSWLSFKWAAWHAGQPAHRIFLTHSERLRVQSSTSRFPRLTMVLREAGAFWFNGVRLAGFELGRLIGIPPKRREAWLD